MANLRKWFSAALAGLAITSLMSPLLMGQTKPATKPGTTQAAPTVTYERAAADLNARDAWLKAELKRLSDIVSQKPDTPRQILNQRNGQMAKDPRPTPKQAIAAATASAENVTRAVSQTLESLRKVKDDKTQLAKTLMLARIYVNEFIDITLIQLKDTDEDVKTPEWISSATQLTAAAGAALDVKLTETIAEAWKAANPEGTTGLGVAGAGGRESVYTVVQGKPIAGLGEVVSGKVSFRINENKGKPIVTPTSMNFTILMTESATFGSTSLADKSLLERRLSLWFVRAPVPDINAADAPAATTPAPAATRGK